MRELESMGRTIQFSLTPWMVQLVFAEKFKIATYDCANATTAYCFEATISLRLWDLDSQKFPNEKQDFKMKSKTSARVRIRLSCVFEFMFRSCCSRAIVSVKFWKRFSRRMRWLDAMGAR